MSGFLSVLSKSPAVWLAIAAATVTATVAFADYISGAKQAREALEAMQQTAEDWKNTAAATFYGNSEGLSFFGMSEGDFSRQAQTAQDWLDGLLKVWTDGKGKQTRSYPRGRNPLRPLPTAHARSYPILRRRRMQAVIPVWHSSLPRILLRWTQWMLKSKPC